MSASMIRTRSMIVYTTLECCLPPADGAGSGGEAARRRDGETAKKGRHGDWASQPDGGAFSFSFSFSVSVPSACAIVIFA